MTLVAVEREVLEYYARASNYTDGDVPGHIYALDDGGGMAHKALGENRLFIPVDSKALLSVLQALNGPGHLIRELQFTRGPIVGDDNPINKLVEEFNAWVTAQNEAADDE
jgi:hypothetical protein